MCITYISALNPDNAEGKLPEMLLFERSRYLCKPMGAGHGGGGGETPYNPWQNLNLAFPPASGHITVSCSLRPQLPWHRQVA
jgi:hypothetical protein